MSTSDEQRARRAALAVGGFVGVASAVIITAGVVILLVVILVTGHHEGDHRPPPPANGTPTPGDSFVVDVDHVLPWVIGLGIVGVALLTLVAWLAARRAAEPLAEALQLQRNFVADASHELRTPLTALSARIQLLQRRHQRGQPIDDTLLDLRRDADAMTALLTDLLLTAEGTNAAPDVPTVVTDAARHAIEAMTPLASDADVILDLRAEPSALVDVPRVTVTRVTIVLLDNAIQHAPAGSTVSLTVGRDGRAITLRVADRGGGIVGIDPERVFDRFARSGETGRRRGFGIGLALVKEVATRYGGDVTVESTSSEGTVFLLTLPAARRATNDSRA